MTRKRLRAILSGPGYEITDAIDDSIESVAHEIAHAVLLFGRVPVYANMLIGERCTKMSAARANDHEAKTIKLQALGLAALNYTQTIRYAAKLSFEGLEFGCTAKRWRDVTLNSFVKQIERQHVSRRSIQRFVQAVRDLERFV